MATVEVETPKEIDLLPALHITEKMTAKVIISKFADNFAKIETHDLRVADIVMDEASFCLFRRKTWEEKENVWKRSDVFLEIKNGLHGWLWGANIWVFKAAKGVMFYPEECSVRDKQHPHIQKAKKLLGKS